MNKCVLFFLITSLCLLSLSCLNGYCRIEGVGEVYLTLLKEDGTAFSDSEAKRFIVQSSNIYGRKARAIINENDKLIFSLGTIRMSYNNCKRLKNKEGFTDNEIISALTDDMYFSIKDIKEPQEYKTVVNKSCKSCFIRFERTKKLPATYATTNEPNHIYYCEIKLETK
ncbi:MAG: hypothetical protein ACTTKH_06615 [Treponema sp.]